MKIDTKKIGTFLKSIDGAEYLYMQHCMDMRNGINNLIKGTISQNKMYAKGLRLSLLNTMIM